ncbi:MAG: TIGR03905 family TSCPD domain-containing protein [Lachnospiraceae bacterium]|nr:TIGR03905 family TSCPD domain-containing protein [Lachnospiraceae bacterium]
MYEYTPHGVCSRKIQFDIDENDVVKKIVFVGGCSGNTQGVAALAAGMTVDEVIARVDGIRCGFKETSCPDQLATALKQYKESKA